MGEVDLSIAAGNLDTNVIHRLPATAPSRLRVNARARSLEADPFASELESPDARDGCGHIRDTVLARSFQAALHRAGMTTPPQHEHEVDAICLRPVIILTPDTGLALPIRNYLSCHILRTLHSIRGHSSDNSSSSRMRRC
jgi:hypothetical protein